MVRAAHPLRSSCSWRHLPPVPGFSSKVFAKTCGIPTDRISLVQHSERDEKTHLVSRIPIEVRLPSSFPEKYRASVVAAANQCTVKKHLQSPPQMEVVAKVEANTLKGVG